MRRLLDPAISLVRMRQQDRLKCQRELFENLEALLTEDAVVKLEEFQGAFSVDRRSDLFRRVILFRQYEPELARCSLMFLDPDRDVLDIGANIGFYSVLFAKNIRADKKVLAIEPTKNALRLLKSNVARNKVDNKVIIVPGIASNSTGSSTIHVVEGREEYSTIGAMQHPSVAGSEYIDEAVDTFTIDDLVACYRLSPGFIKMDVEGAEGLALEGAVKTISHHRPVILSELSDKLLLSLQASSAQVVERIKSFGYHVIDPIDPKLPPGNKEYGDVLCIPEESPKMTLVLQCASREQFLRPNR